MGALLHKKLLIWVAVGYLLAHVVTYVTHAYAWLPWIDIPAHLVFGAWMMLFLMYFPYWRQQALLAFLLVLCIGLVWEGAEYAHDLWLAPRYNLLPAVHGTLDTISDTLCNALGALAGLWFIHRS